MLVNQAISEESATHFVEDLLQHVPRFQYGMDVNPKFTAGIDGYEYTAELTAFDMLRVKMVHGWLIDPQDLSLYTAVGTTAYNALIEKVIAGKEAEEEGTRVEAELKRLQGSMPEVDLLDDGADQSESQRHQTKMVELQGKLTKLHSAANDGVLINEFLESTSHQLTQFGLHQLYDDLKEDELTVFFRNNHFGTLTKHQGILYLLVTDLGYASTPNIVWEKLDVIDGDTEYVNADFRAAGEAAAVQSGSTLTPDQLMAQSGQKESDYQLALKLSQNANLDEEEGKLMAAATEASLKSYHGVPDSKPAAAPPPEHVVVGVPLEGLSPTAALTTGGTIVQLPPSVLSSLPQTVASNPDMTQAEADQLYAMQLMQEEANLDEASVRLARQLEAEERKRAAAPRPPQRQAVSTGKDSSNCIIS